MATTNNALETMKTIRFGIEIETVGISRRAVAEAIQGVVGGSTHYIGSPSCYDPWRVDAADGRRWMITRDGSLTGGGAEVASPICTYEDLETIQQVARALRAKGAKVDWSCGIHIHIDGGRFDAAQISRLAKLVYSQEELIVKALRAENRMRGDGSVPCRMVDEAFINRMRRGSSVQSLNELNALWYGRQRNVSLRFDRYDTSRYHGLNLHSLFTRGTVEFRYFGGTLHAGKIKSYIQLVLALGARAINSRGAVARKRTYNTANPRYAFRNLLLRLGVNGPDFKTLRHHLLSHLPGNSAWAVARPEQAQSASVPA